MSNGKQGNDKMEKYQSRAKMLEILMGQIYEQDPIQEQKEDNTTNIIFTIKNQTL
jgi:hypothetical protein